MAERGRLLLAVVLVEVPASIPDTSNCLHAAAPDLAHKESVEPVARDSFHHMRDVDALLILKVFHVPQRQRVARKDHHREADNLRPGLEVAGSDSLRLADEP